MNADYRQLLLVRHGKSSWKTPLPEDHERPLAGRGKKAVPLMARWLDRQPWLPERLLCSTALRTRQTATLLLDTLKLNTNCLHLDRQLYEANAEQILTIIQNTPARIQCLMVVGHNPGLECLIERLNGPVTTPPGQKVFPTAAVARLISDSSDWQLEAGNSRLIDITRPADMEPEAVQK